MTEEAIKKIEKAINGFLYSECLYNYIELDNDNLGVSFIRGELLAEFIIERLKSRNSIRIAISKEANDVLTISKDESFITIRVSRIIADIPCNYLMEAIRLTDDDIKG
jgi:hypothetical protein